MISLAASFRLSRRSNAWPLKPDFKYFSFHSQENRLTTVLQSCEGTTEISQIHGVAVKTGLDQNPFCLSKLLAASIHDIEYAASIFRHVLNPNLFMYNTMLRGHSLSVDPGKAFFIFRDLRAQGIEVDQFSFITTLKACTRAVIVEAGTGIHGIVVKSGFRFFINVKNALLHFYSVCGRMGDAHQLFDECSPRNDLISWNTLMSGYVRASQPTVVIELFRQMCKAGFVVSVTTILSILSAVGNLGDSSRADSIHGYCVKIGFTSYLNVVTALIDMYAKVGCVDLGHRLFDGVVKKDVILWNCLIDGYAKNGLLAESVALLQEMKLDGIKANSSTLAGLLSACAASGALGVGQFINKYVEEEELALDVILGTSLVDLYAKCGIVGKAIDVFNKMESKDVKSWTAMILGYGVHGQARNAIKLFCRMEEEGIKPNDITFLAVLSACSHGGLVEEGMRYFERMVKIYGFKPKVEHYGCLVDLMGRAGLLEEAYRLIKSLDTESDATAWRALLAACRVYGDIVLGECVTRILAENYGEHPTDSILLSSTYAISGRLPGHTQMQISKREEVTKEAKLGQKREKKIRKEAGCSKFEMDSWEETW